MIQKMYSNGSVNLRKAMHENFKEIHQNFHESRDMEDTPFME